MNWYAVRIVALIACALATVVLFALTMANIEYGSSRTARWCAVLTAALFTADALLLGSVS